MKKTGRRSNATASPRVSPELRRFAYYAVLLLAGSLALGGCAAAKKPVAAEVEDVLVEGGAETRIAEEGLGPSYGAGISGGAEGIDLDAPSENLLNERSVYFDYDSDIISPDYREIIEAHTRYLTRHGNTMITLEGHADERGTREYNLALGERRALAVKRLMSLIGVSPDQVRVISHGEERPYAYGHDEESWRLNRRVDIVY